MIKMKEFKDLKDIKILFFSFEPISLVNSNGRTLRNIIKCFSKESIYNIYLHGIPDLDSSNYLCVSDKQALKSAFFMKPRFINPEFEKTAIKHEDENNNRKGFLKNRSNLKLLIREFVWKSHSMRKNLLKQVKNIDPDIIVVLMGNAGFMLNNATYISKKLGIPLITFNCEDYYFKNYDYIQYKKHRTFIHKWYKRKFVKSVDLIMKNASASIYLTDELKELYSKVFPKQNAFAIYNSSDLIDEKVSINDNPKNKNFLYAGNVGIGRLDELEKIGAIIKQINPEFNLVVYSEEIRPNLVSRLNNSKFIVFKGFLDYQSVVKEMKQSFAVVHVESSDPFYSEHTIHGFTTKIADCLSTGNCFLVKCNKESTVYNYLKTNDCAYCCSDEAEVRDFIDSIINDNHQRLRYVNRAIEIANLNHSSKKNSEKFYSIVKSTLAR